MNTSLSIIVAVAKNNVIGRNNDLIWHLPADMKYFKETTAGHSIITGRKNYESIPEKYRPLPNRVNIVVTRQENYVAPGAVVLPSVDAAIAYAKQLEGHDEIFIIGGGEIYKQSIAKVDKLYITKIEQAFEGDTYFPALDMTYWVESKKSAVFLDEKSGLKYSFCEYVRKQTN
jgi:dihydrofolate reductase